MDAEHPLLHHPHEVRPGLRGLLYRRVVLQGLGVPLGQLRRLVRADEVARAVQKKGRRDAALHAVGLFAPPHVLDRVACLDEDPLQGADPLGESRIRARWGHTELGRRARGRPGLWCGSAGLSRWWRRLERRSRRRAGLGGGRGLRRRRSGCRRSRGRTAGHCGLSLGPQVRDVQVTHLRPVPAVRADHYLPRRVLEHRHEVDGGPLVDLEDVPAGDLVADRAGVQPNVADELLLHVAPAADEDEAEHQDSPLRNVDARGTLDEPHNMVRCALSHERTSAGIVSRNRESEQLLRRASRTSSEDLPRCVPRTGRRQPGRCQISAATAASRRSFCSGVPMVMRTCVS